MTMKRQKDKGLRTIFKGTYNVESPIRTINEALKDKGKKMLTLPEQLSSQQKCSFHYLFAVFQRNYEAMVQGLQVSE